MLVLEDVHTGVKERRVLETEVGGKGKRQHNLGKSTQIWPMGQREIIMAGRERCETVKVCWIGSSFGVRRSRRLNASAHDAQSLAFTHISYRSFLTENWIHFQNTNLKNNPPFLFFFSF